MGEIENNPNQGKEVLETIREQEAKGRVVIMTVDGLTSVSLEELVSQPAEGILYDLNRDTLTTSTLLMASGEDLHLPNMRLVNDYAAALVIKYLKNKLDNGAKE